MQREISKGADSVSRLKLRDLLLAPDVETVAFDLESLDSGGRIAVDRAERAYRVI
jgi:hypothetical protein